MSGIGLSRTRGRLSEASLWGRWLAWRFVSRPARMSFICLVATRTGMLSPILGTRASTKPKTKRSLSMKESVRLGVCSLTGAPQQTAVAQLSSLDGTGDIHRLHLWAGNARVDGAWRSSWVCDAIQGPRRRRSCREALLATVFGTISFIWPYIFAVVTSPTPPASSELPRSTI